MAAEMGLKPRELADITPKYFFELWKAHLKRKEREVLMLSLRLNQHSESNVNDIFMQLNHLLNEAPNPDEVRQTKMRKYTPEELAKIQELYELNKKK